MIIILQSVFSSFKYFISGNYQARNQNNTPDNFEAPNNNGSNEIVEELLEAIQRYPFYLEKNEKMISIIFISVDENVHYSLICKNTDSINSIENRLIKEYPELSNTDNYFLYKGKEMNKFKIFEDYKIKNGDIITIIQK